MASTRTTSEDIEIAEALLRFNSAVAVVGTVVAAIAGMDVWLIGSKRTSISSHVGCFARAHPVMFWAGWVSLGAHLALEADDPLNKLGRLIERLWR